MKKFKYNKQDEMFFKRTMIMDDDGSYSITEKGEMSIATLKNNHLNEKNN